jgi:hypothetical protein
VNRVVFDFNDKFSLLTDGNQWLVARRGKRDRWDAIAFIASNKMIVQRVLNEKGIKMTEDAKRAMDDLPFKFRDFIAEAADD